jgi:hypothetical protein
MKDGLRAERTKIESRFPSHIFSKAPNNLYNQRVKSQREQKQPYESHHRLRFLLSLSYATQSA